MRTLKKDSLILFLAAITTIFLSACTKLVSNENTERLILPTIVEYSRATQSEVKRELENCLDCDATKELIIDYGIMRDQTREALK